MNECVEDCNTMKIWIHVYKPQFDTAVDLTRF